MSFSPRRLTQGLVGTLLAVPLLACFKIMCDHIDRLRPAGQLLA